MKNHVGTLPEGCKLCEKGAKIVLFVTGICDKKCFYCPLSEKRKDKDLTWANERPVRTDEDVINEARRMNALGAGITGGDPGLKVDRTISYIEMFKEIWPDFHIHLYTSSVLDSGTLKKLKNAGLDELRFHLLDEGMWESIEDSIKLGIDTGIEIPVLPGDEHRIIGMAKRLESMDGGFINLNELEFSERNLEHFRKRGYALKSELSYAAKGSEETAFEVMKDCPDFNVHFCSSSFKDSIQLRNRLIRTAENVAKDFEAASKDGLLLKGVITLENPGIRKLKVLMADMKEEFEIPENLMYLDRDKMRLETTMEIAEALSKLNTRRGVKYMLVEEYPTFDRLETEVIPLERKSL